MLKNHQPLHPILVSDFKVNKWYLQNIAKSCEVNFPMLVISLYLCWSISAEYHATIKICDTQENFAKFFHTVKFAVDFLSKVSLKNTYFQVDPLHHIDNSIITVHLNSRNVYYIGDKVYKLFDTVTERWARPNVSVIN